MNKIKLSSIMLVCCIFFNVPALHTQSLKYVRTVEITTDAGGRGARPEIHFASNRFYIIYLGIVGPAKTAFKVKVYDRNLENVLTEKIIVESDTTYGGCTDIRSVADSDGVYLFYEKANAAKDSAFLFSEKYTFNEGFTKVHAYNGPFAQGAYWYTAQAGDELLDDPASVIVGGRVCVMTKIRGEERALFSSVPTYRVRELNPSLSEVDTTFDITIPEMHGWAWVNSLLYNNGSIYHLQPSLASDNPPVNLDLNLLRFTEDWQYQSSDVSTISNESWSESMPIGFALDESGFYYVTFSEPATALAPPDTTQTGPNGNHLWLKMFDSNFNEIQTVSLLDTAYLGTHPTIAITEDSVYVAYGKSVPDPYAENIVVDVFLKDVNVGVEDSDNTTPRNFKLLQNYPNPFNPSTTIEYDLAVSGYVVLRLYDVLGRAIQTLVDEKRTSGRHSVIWDGKDSFGDAVTSGVYFLQMSVGDFVRTRRLLLLK